MLSMQDFTEEYASCILTQTQGDMDTMTRSQDALGSTRARPDVFVGAHGSVRAESGLLRKRPPPLTQGPSTDSCAPPSCARDDDDSRTRARPLCGLPDAAYRPSKNQPAARQLERLTGSTADSPTFNDSVALKALKDRTHSVDPHRTQRH